MKRCFLITIIMGMICSLAYPHDFIKNSDYVYVVGEGKTQDEAERAAFLSLTSKLKIEVKQEVRHSLTSDGKNVNETFSDVSGIYSNLTFGDEVQTEIERVRRKHYRVYKYINKREYISQQHALSDYYFAMADSLERFGNRFSKHSQNVILGYYYNAYKALDTELMNAFENNDGQKRRIMNRDSLIYYSSRYGVPTLIKSLASNYYVEMGGVVSKNEPIGLCGFEYFFKGGWNTPLGLYVHSYDGNQADTHDIFDEVIYRKCTVRSDNNKIRYRILYEYEENGKFYRIDVDNKWYFGELFITNLNHVK